LVEIVSALIDVAEPVLDSEDLLGALPDFRLARKDAGKIGPALRLSEQAIERGARHSCFPGSASSSGENADRRLDVLELYLVHLSDAESELHETRGIARELVELDGRRAPRTGRQRSLYVGEPFERPEALLVWLSTAMARAYESNAFL
jgi:hypothetical protein